MEGDGTVILLDTSSSMALPVGNRRRADVLADILKALPAGAAIRRVSFNSIVTEVAGKEAWPEPGGGTALASALTFAAGLRPARVIVISDGEPDNAEAALAVARDLGAGGCHIETYFCGDERAHEATAFLRALAWCSHDGFGRTAVADLSRPELLEGELRLALRYEPP